MKEKLEPNVVEPTLFIGMGGIGSRIIKGVANLCLYDKTDNIRFVTLDTDVNDLSRLENGSVIETVQTSSTRSIRDYLDFDKDAKNNWFPNNKILDSKTVSEGAGQVRAISRLALNATIKKGTISKLYNCIDELFLKDGGDKQRAIKVVIASTVAGGTGSGIALEVAMIVRDYLKRNYPESAAIIRGFFIMPGVMDTVIKSESERDSIARNGYATLKEINAFMMKGSGFFDSDPRLKRYKDLSLTIPSASGPDIELDNLPFDFCFLIDKTDENQHSMKFLKQYEEFASQSIYEQNIGPMRKSASSKEDNIVKEFIVPEKLGRCRFGGAGAAVLRYPYEQVRDYIAYNWIEKNIIGINNSKEFTEEEKAAMIKNSWLAYDNEYKQELKKFENDMTAKDDEKPSLPKVYMAGVESQTLQFSNKIQNRFINAKYNFDVNEDEQEKSKSIGLKAEQLAQDFVQAVTDKICEELLSSKSSGGTDEEGNKITVNENYEIAAKNANHNGFKARYNAIEALETFTDTKLIDLAVEKVLKESLKTDQRTISDKVDKHTIEAFVKTNGIVMHPNAARYLLYKLIDVLEETSKQGTSEDSYNSTKDKATTGLQKNGEVNTKDFQVALNFKKETNLSDMCDELDDIDGGVKESANSDKMITANKNLTMYFNAVTSYYSNTARVKYCKAAIGFVKKLASSYEKFYNSFEDKITSIAKRKENILSSIEFQNGDCIQNLFCKKEDMNMLVADQGEGAGRQEEENKLFASIFDAVKSNAIIDEKSAVNPYLRESKKDIFEEIVVKYYQDTVEASCAEKIDLDILHAIKYEYEIQKLVQISKANTEEEKEMYKKLSNDKEAIDKHIGKMMKRVQCLASPGISKNSFDEARSVEAIAWGTGIKDGNGIYVSDYGQLEEKNRSASVSKYELRFFSSIYGIEPTDISKLAYHKTDDDDKYSIVKKESGYYFKKYQEYMKNIGPDSRINPVITPHIDRRWNSISVMPEIDLNFQEDLMKYIHAAFVYGLLYRNIVLKPLIPSIGYKPGDEVETSFKYTDERGNVQDLIVSNGTSCDQLYEVLDSLYFDRATVDALTRIADKKRTEDANKGSKGVDYTQTGFSKAILNLKRSMLTGVEDNDDRTPISLFEIPVLYYNSLPVKKKDISEITTMTNAIFDIIEHEINTFCNEKTAKADLKNEVARQFELLCQNYRQCAALKNAPADILVLIKETIIERLEANKGAAPSVITEATF